MTFSVKQSILYAVAATLFGTVVPTATFAQKTRVDSLLRIVRRSVCDTSTANALAELSSEPAAGNRAKRLAYADSALKLALRFGYRPSLARAYVAVGRELLDTHPSEAGDYLRKAMKLTDEKHDYLTIGRAWNGMALMAERNNDHIAAIGYFKKALAIYEHAGHQLGIGTAYLRISISCRNLWKQDSADAMIIRGLDAIEKTGDMKFLTGVEITQAQDYLADGWHDKAMPLYERGRVHAERFGDKAGIAKCLYGIGYILYRKYAFPRAIDSLQKCVTLSMSIGDTALAARAMTVIANFHRIQGRIPQALEMFERSAALLRRVHDVLALTEAEEYIARIQRDRGDYYSAYLIYQQHLRIGEAKGEKLVIQSALRNLAKVQQYRGFPDSAIALLERAARLIEELASPSHKAVNLIEIGTLYHQFGYMDKARDALDKSLALERALGDSANIARVLQNIAAVEIDQGLYTSAMEKLQQCISIQERFGGKGELNALTGIASIHMYQHRYEEARRISKKVLAADLDSGTSSEQEIALYNMGVTFSNEGKTDSALAYLRQCLSLSEKMEDVELIDRALGGLAGTYYQRDDFDAALLCARRGLALSEQLRNNYGQTHNLQLIAKILVRTGALDSAQETAQRALSIARAGGTLNQIQNALDVLREIAVTRGDFQHAYSFHTEVSSIQDSLINTANLRSINEMQAQYDAREKEKTIRLLEKDRQLQALTLEQNRKVLTLQQLEAERSRQRVELLLREKEYSLLQLDKNATELKLKTQQLALQNSEREKVTKEKEYLASIATQETLLRNALLMAFALFVVSTFLGVKRIKQRKREATVRAEAAEFEARALKAEALAHAAEYDRRRKTEMEQFTHRLIASQEQERARIARELHDSLGQELLVIKNQAHLALQWSGRVGDIEERLRSVKSIALEMLDEIRSLSRNLRPVQLERSGLSSTIRQMLRQLEGASSVRIDSIVDEIDGLFGKDEEINVYRLLQESMNNVLKHAEARRVTVSVRRSNGDVRLQVRDDGRGFNVENMRGFGLQGMEERVQIMKGRMSVESIVGRGTNIDIALPGRRSTASDERIPPLAAGNTISGQEPRHGIQPHETGTS